MSNPFASSSPPPVFGEQAAYAPPSGGAWGAQAPLTGEDEEEPFTAAHLAAANQAAVPSVTAGAPPPAPPAGNSASLAFTQSTAAAPASLTGRVGAPTGGSASPVPRVGSAADTALLSSSPGPSAAPGGGGGGGGGAAGGPAGAPQEDPSRYAFYNIKRYRGLFNVDTTDVLARLARSVLLFFRGNFLEYCGDNPDLYGPFWVATTLIFVTAAAGNLASYIDYQRHAPAGDTHGGWYYDIDKVGGSFGIFYGYVGVVGLVLYFVLRWFKAGVPLAAVWCVYGYALAAFIPVSMVCIVPLEAVRWALVGAATLTSGTFIMLSLRAPIHEAAGAKAAPLYIVMICVHAGLGLALKLYFFRYKEIPLK